MKILKGSQGIALVVVIMMMVILLSITGATLLFSGLNLKTASNFKTTSAAMQVADAGTQHALALIPLGTTFSYTTETTLLNSYSFGNGYTYTVTAINDAASSGGNSRAVLVAVASRANGSARKVKAYIGRSTASWVPPGTVHIPGTSRSDEAFDPSGANWTVNGNDTNYDNTAGSQSAIVGITATDPTVVESIKNALDGEPKRKRVTGVGYATGPPTTPSVQQATRPDDVNVIGQNFINQVTATTCPPKCLSGLNYDLTTCPATNPCTLGTDASPQVTYITGGSTVNLGGYTSGSRVLVIHADKIKLLDNFDFHGLVIHLQRTVTTSDPELHFTIKGDAKIYGSILLGPNNNELEFEIKDRGAVRYSSQAINMVNTNWGSCCLPRPARVTAWVELTQ